MDEFNLQDPELLGNLVRAACVEMGQETHPIAKRAWANLANELNNCKSWVIRRRKARERYEEIHGLKEDDKDKDKKDGGKDDDKDDDRDDAKKPKRKPRFSPAPVFKDEDDASS